MITSDDMLEFVKVIIILILGYILIKGLLFGTGGEEITKCMCECAKDVIYLN